MAFDEIVVDPCPPKPSEEPDSSNPFDEALLKTGAISHPVMWIRPRATDDLPDDPNRDSEEDGQ